MDTVEKGIHLKIRSSRNWDQGIFFRCPQGSLVLNTEMKDTRAVVSPLAKAISSTRSSSNFYCQLSCSLTAVLHQGTDPACKAVSSFLLKPLPCLVPFWSHRRVVPAEYERQHQGRKEQWGVQLHWRNLIWIEADQRTAEGEEMGMGGWERQGEPGGQTILAAENPGTKGIRGSLFEELCTSKEGERNTACRRQ